MQIDIDLHSIATDATEADNCTCVTQNHMPIKPLTKTLHIVPFMRNQPCIGVSNTHRDDFKVIIHNRQPDKNADAGLFRNLRYL